MTGAPGGVDASRIRRTGGPPRSKALSRSVAEEVAGSGRGCRQFQSGCVWRPIAEKEGLDKPTHRSLPRGLLFRAPACLLGTKSVSAYREARNGIGLTSHKRILPGRANISCKAVVGNYHKRDSWKNGQDNRRISEPHRSLDFPAS